MPEKEANLEEELRKLAEQAEAVANALAQKLERELGPRLEEAARALEQKLSQVDWDKLERQTQQALRKGLEKARQALDRALEELESRPHARPSQPDEEDERLVILRMVYEGKLSPEEALRLLEALEEY